MSLNNPEILDDRLPQTFQQELLIIRQAQKAMEALIAFEPNVQEMGGREKIRQQVILHSEFVNTHLKAMASSPALFIDFKTEK